ncbi:hypothetical protein ACHHYP_01935 [Achlya hypogyna]|uniref:Transmembrane protein n=1 Tax=Achlya hypogyna TaxID=1202772 RepID=A0A1V9Z7T6_ACHHY|nr:hypothetical protein ACHHYP_01935 [Achlya hypogyna]
MRHVPCPTSLLQLQSDVHEAMSTLLSATPAAQDDYAAIKVMSTMVPVPVALSPTAVVSVRGSVLCGVLPSPMSFSMGMDNLFSAKAPCTVGYNEWVYTIETQVAFAAAVSLAFNTTARVALACQAEMVAPVGCVASLISIAAFLTKYFSEATLAAFETRATAVQYDINAHGVVITQYIKELASGNVSFFHQSVFTPTDPAMHFAGWIFAYDWATGAREVVSFEGDTGTFAMLSTSVAVTTFSASPYELPTNVAVYFRVLCQYISSVLLFVAVMAVIYSVANGFKIEGSNLWKVNRVGGMVWIGRPLLLLRSTTALCILSTAELQLSNEGDLTMFIASDARERVIVATISKVLAAGELCWLVYIAVDYCMVVTQELTASYSSKTAILVWILAAALSLASPVTHNATINRQCVVTVVDYALVCHSGVVTIGSKTRFLQLVALALGISGAIYFHDRLRYTPELPAERPSYLLSCGAKYLFQKTAWVHGGVYYIDCASAALAGLLVFRHRRITYVFDIKTWRTLALSQETIEAKTQFHPTYRCLAAAIPCVQ